MRHTATKWAIQRIDENDRVVYYDGSGCHEYWVINDGNHRISVWGDYHDAQHFFQVRFADKYDDARVVEYTGRSTATNDYDRAMGIL